MTEPVNDVETIREALERLEPEMQWRDRDLRPDALQALERLSASRDEALGDVHGLSEGLLAATERAQRAEASRERYREALERMRRDALSSLGRQEEGRKTQAKLSAHHVEEIARQALLPEVEKK